MNDDTEVGKIIEAIEEANENSVHEMGEVKKATLGISHFKSRKKMEILDLLFKKYEVKSDLLLDEKLHFYKCGMHHRIPGQWLQDFKNLEKEYDNKRDPEYEKYLQLKERFE